ncbi:MAG: response regulator [Candidatus Doudnabacteria bacterium]
MENKQLKQTILLIVEDELTLSEVLRDKFRSEGFEVMAAGDGAEGLAMALSHHPDIILLDIVMQKMGGISVLQKLREDTWGKTASIIVLTNLMDQEKKATAAQYGVSDYLIKTDYSLDDLIKRVKDKLSH